MTEPIDPKENRRQAARRGHHACPKCGGLYTTTEVDGSKCDGIPGIKYLICGNCGHARMKPVPKHRLTI